MPLKGLQVIELSGLAPGPLCGKFLRDYGADVILVHKMSDGSLSNFDVVSNGKKSIAIDLKSVNGSHVFRRLVTFADILIEPFRKGVMEKLGFSPHVLMTDNPKLIYARLSGYGQQGHFSSMAGHDINYLSMTGLLSMYGWRGKHPIPPSNFSEFAGGSLICFSGILLALLERNKTGKGQVIDSNIVEGLSYLGSWLIKSQKMLFANTRGTNILDGGSHFYDTYETKDGKFMAVGAIEPKFYDELLSKLNLSYEEVPQDDFENGRRIFTEKFKEKTRDEWCKVFDQSDACVTPVLTVTEAAQHKHNVDRKTFTRNDDGTVTPARAPRLSVCIQSDEIMPPASYCADTITILQEIGYSNEEIKKLNDDGVIKINGSCKL
ncbi:hypothetical protein PGB90_009156 [Kerria lacca]